MTSAKLEKLLYPHSPDFPPHKPLLKLSHGWSHLQEGSTIISTQPGSALYPHKGEKKPPPSRKGTRIPSLGELVLSPQTALTRTSGSPRGIT